MLLWWKHHICTSLGCGFKQIKSTELINKVLCCWYSTPVTHKYIFFSEESKTHYLIMFLPQYFLLYILHEMFQIRSCYSNHIYMKHCFINWISSQFAAWLTQNMLSNITWWNHEERQLCSHTHTHQITQTNLYYSHYYLSQLYTPLSLLWQKNLNNFNKIQQTVRTVYEKNSKYTTLMSVPSWCPIMSLEFIFFIYCQVCLLCLVCL